MFEGEYSNGERNGKGKEYYTNGKIRFEGEYFNGKKWKGKIFIKYPDKFYILQNGKGYVKEYDNIQDILFEGEYLNGNQWKGKGEEFDWNGNLIFEGEY